MDGPRDLNGPETKIHQFNSCILVNLLPIQTQIIEKNQCYVHSNKFEYSGRRLMGSWIIGSIG
jgi:hypothetical protein